MADCQHIPTVGMSGLDCRNPGRVSTGMVSHICRQNLLPNSATSLNKTLVLQYSDQRVVTGYRCELRYSEFSYICGFLSHTKLYSPPSILVPQILKPEICRNMVKKGTYQKEDGTLINIRKNQRITYHFIRHGTLFHSHENVACTGATMTINGEEVSGLVDMISAEIVFKTISVESNLGKMTDLDNNEQLPPVCSLGTSCQVGTTSYVIDQPINRCPLTLIRAIEMQQIQLNGKNGIQTALVNHEHKILLSLERKEVAPSTCKPVFGYYATEYPGLKVVVSSAEISMAEISNMRQNLDPSLLNLEVEVKVVDSYLAYYLEQQITSSIQTLSSKLCSINSHSLQYSELSPFHPDSLLRIRGDIIQELQCTPVRATARIGEKRNEKCFSDSLPVWINNQPMRMQARTHLILDEDPLDEVPCEAAYMPIFVATDGTTLLSAKPDVYIVDMQIGHLEENYLHLTDVSKLEHPSFGKDLLYTQEEINQFNNLIHFQRTKHRVLNALINDYCEGNDNCGAYQPALGTSSGFNLKNLEDKVYSPFQIFFDWSEKLSKIGNVCSIAIVFMTIMSLIFKLYKVLWLSCKHRMGMGQAIKLGLFVDTTLMRALVDSTPPVPLLPEAPTPSRPLPDPDYQNRQPQTAVIEEIPLSTVPSTTRRLQHASPSAISTYEPWRNWND